MVTTTLITCFALLLVPSEPQKPVSVVTGFTDVNLAVRVRNDIMGGDGRDTADRLKNEAYRASEQYQIDIRKAAQEQEEREAANKKRCAGKKDNDYFFCANPVLSIGSAIIGYPRPFTNVLVIGAPPQTCKLEN